MIDQDKMHEPARDYTKTNNATIDLVLESMGGDLESFGLVMMCWHRYVVYRETPDAGLLTDLEMAMFRVLQRDEDAFFKKWAKTRITNIRNSRQREAIKQANDPNLAKDPNRPKAGLTIQDLFDYASSQGIKKSVVVAFESEHPDWMRSNEPIEDLEKYALSKAKSTLTGK